MDFDRLAMDSNNFDRLIFVYNANSGIGNALLGGIHKILSPSTYNCNLCAITFGAFSENIKWKEFRQDSGLEMDFIHRDEFKGSYPNEQYDKAIFPKIFISKGGKLQEFLNVEEINAMEGQEDLIMAIKVKFGKVMAGKGKV